MGGHIIAIFGGTGFVGRHLIAELARGGHTLKVCTRRKDSHRDLLPLPRLELLEGDINDPKFLDKMLKGCDTIVNLVGILNEKGNDGTQFNKVHVELPRNLIKLSRKYHIKRILHISALNAEAGHGPSYYLRSKGEAENLYLAARDLNTTIFRPSIIFGAGDNFFNRFARLLKRVPLFFPLACSYTRFAPVYVGDLVANILATLDDPRSYGKIYEVCGPKVYSMKQLVEFTARCTGSKRWIWGLGRGLSNLQAHLFEFVPGKPISIDNFRSAEKDSLCSNKKLKPPIAAKTTVEAVVPYYLSSYSYKQRFDNYRKGARRD